MSEPMRTIGLIGGISWHSTAEYYRMINQLVASRLGGHASAKIALQSVNFAEVRVLQENEDWAAAGQLLATAGRQCEAAGADVVLICANLMHRVADDVAAAIDVPLLHIADAVVARSRALGVGRLGLLGTRWVMEEDFYRDRLIAGGLEVDIPDTDERRDLDAIIFSELTQGLVVPESRDRLVEIIDRLYAGGAEAVVLACTELELLLTPEQSRVPLLDTTRIHAEAAVETALAELDGSTSPDAG